MSEFINTIDVLGDDAVIDSIIQRTITEFKDNRINTVGAYAFYNCTALTELDIPNAKIINEAAFEGCSSLKKIVLEKVTNLRNAFRYCTSLEIVDIHTSVGDIDKPYEMGLQAYTFSNNPSLKAVILRDPSKMCCMGHFYVFASTPVYPTWTGEGVGYIYVPKIMADGSDGVALYDSSSNWAHYAGKFRAIEDYTVDGTLWGELDPMKI